MEAVLLDTVSGSTAIELYLTIRNVKVTLPQRLQEQGLLNIHGERFFRLTDRGFLPSTQICANDDLVTKKFACSTSEESVGGALSGLEDQPPAVLGCDIFQDTGNFLATSGCLARSLSSLLPTLRNPPESLLPPLQNPPALPDGEPTLLRPHASNTCISLKCSFSKTELCSFIGTAVLREPCFTVSDPRGGPSSSQEGMEASGDISEVSVTYHSTRHDSVLPA